MIQNLKFVEMLQTSLMGHYASTNNVGISAYAEKDVSFDTVVTKISEYRVEAKIQTTLFAPNDKHAQHVAAQNIKKVMFADIRQEIEEILAYGDDIRSVRARLNRLWELLS